MVQQAECISGGATIKAELTSGEIVNLVKDCECLDEIHTGPHWVYMDKYWQAESQRIYGFIYLANPYMKIVLWNDFCEHETRRLDRFCREMRRCGIARLIKEEVA